MNNSLLWRSVIKLVHHVIGISPEQGAETQIYLATSPEVAHVTGKYFYRKVPVDPNPMAKDEVAVERLWKMSAHLTALPA